MLGVNESRFLVEHDQREFECRVDASACNSNQKLDHDVSVMIKMIGNLVKIIVFGILVPVMQNWPLKMIYIQILKIVHVKNIYLENQYQYVKIGY